MPRHPTPSRLPPRPARRDARPSRTRARGRHPVHGPLRADAARQHQRRRQPAADLPRRRQRLHQRAQPGRDQRHAEQQLQHGLRRRRRRRDHGQLLDRHALAARGRDGHVGRALLGRRHGDRHRRLGRARPREPRQRALQGRRRRLPDGRRRARRRADLHRQGHALPRLRQRHGPAAGGGQRHLHRGATSRPAAATTASRAGRSSSPTRTRRRRCTGSASTTASARSTRRTPSPPTSRRSTRPRAAPWPRRPACSRFEGDTGIVGETATFNGTALTDAINGPGNLLNSTMATDGTLFTAKNPNYGNLMGTDIDVWNSTGLLANHQSSAVLAFTSNQDLFVPSALWLVSDEGPAVNTAGPTRRRRRARRLDADRQPRQLGRHADDHLRVPVAALRRRRRQLRRHPRRNRLHLHADPRRRRQHVRVLVTAVNDAGSSPPAASAASGTVAQLAPSNVTLPQVSGTERDDQTLTTTLGGWNGTAPLDYDVQWQRCDALGANCADIAGATALELRAHRRRRRRDRAQRGHRLERRRLGHRGLRAATGTVDPDPPANTTAPTVSGVARDGQTLTAGDGAWTGTDPLDLRLPVAALRRRRHELHRHRRRDERHLRRSRGADVGHAVRVQVTATNVAGNATASSVADHRGLADPPANTAAPTLSGSALEGGTLTLDTGTWTGTAPLDYDIVWQRCDGAGDDCQAIAGETGSTYTLTDGRPRRHHPRARHRLQRGRRRRRRDRADRGRRRRPARQHRRSRHHRRPRRRRDADRRRRHAGPARSRCSTPTSGSAATRSATTAPTSPAPRTPTYTLTGADIGQVVRVVVTAANDAGAAAAELDRLRRPVDARAARQPRGADDDRHHRASGEVLTAHDGTWTGSHADDRHLPVGALRHRRRQLRRHRRRHRRHLHAHRRRRRPHRRASR